MPAATAQLTHSPPSKPAVASPTSSKIRTVKPRTKTSSTPKQSADSDVRDASTQQEDSSRAMTPQGARRKQQPHGKLMTPSKKDQSREVEIPSATYGSAKPTASYRYTDRFDVPYTISLPAVPTLCKDVTPTAYSSTPNPGSLPSFYAFGWDAHPTRALLNEVCRLFLHGKCRLAENCHRIHPRNTSLNPQTFVIKLPTQNFPLTITHNTISTIQADSLSKITHDAPPIPGPRAHNHLSKMEADPPVRCDPQHGILPLPYSSDPDSGQTSDSSQYLSANSSPLGSSCSLTSEGSEVKTSVIHPPPPNIYLCRHWLMKLCRRGYECSYVHGDLQYEPSVKSVYPPPISRIPCRSFKRGICWRGYRCEYFHDDLKYSQPSDISSSGKGNDESLVDLPLRPPLNHAATATQGSFKEENVVERGRKYPQPRSNRFCQEWLIDRCRRGPHCFYFHGDVEYDPPLKGIHPPPRYPHTCKLWLLQECFLGFACQFVHGDLEYDAPEPSESPRIPPSAQKMLERKVAPPRFQETCQHWIRNACQRGQSCDCVHPDLVHDASATAPLSVSRTVPPIVKTPLVHESGDDPPVGMRPHPKSSDTCIQWLRGRCNARYACKYRHDDLDYDPPGGQRSESDRRPERPPTSVTGNNYASTEARAWSVKVHDHAKVKLGPGFDIQELETGFETPWIYLGNVPARATAEDVADLLRPFGNVVDVRLPIRVQNPSMLVRARFSSPVEAREASTALNGAQAFGCKISARLPVHDASRHNAMFEDTAVRIRWEAPGKVGYGGYSTMEHAKEALVAARIPFGDHYVHASVHVGLPVVGVVTVRFRGLPLDATKEDMARFARPDDIVWARPNYQNLDYATQGIKRLLQENTELLDFVVLPPPYRSGAIVQAWAHFSTPTDAKAACGRLHGRKPVFTGKTRVFAQHVQSLTFSLSSAVYEKMGDDIQALCATVHHVRRTAMSVVQRPAPLATLVKLSGDDLKELGLLKAELEKILKGETVHRGANIAWDPFFAHPAGRAFLERVEREAPAVTIHVDTPRRMIRLLGSSRSRLTARQRILAKIDELQSQQIHTIPLDGWLLGYFMGKVLMQLQNQVGREHVDLDFCNRRLVIRGSDTAYKAAREAVRRARQARLHPARRRNAVECPVCFDEVTNPVTLPCGHSWCRDCISRYLTSAIDNKYFPLTCLGGNAKCREHIPLQVARQFLTISEFDAIVDAALAFYIHSRPDEFHYCPSPDCPQIYRRAPRETVLQCPSCLLRICPSCHVEAHDGFTCPDPEGDNKLFRVWMKNHDVKPCPGCKVPIERAEGCHHMTCTQCKTHICWVCLQTFPKGDGIYDHMRAVHGGIGLGAD